MSSDKSYTDLLVEKIDGSQVFVSIAPQKPDERFLMELGIAVWLNKPIVVWAPGGRDVPDGLRAVASSVICGEMEDIGQELVEAIEKEVR